MRCSLDVLISSTKSMADNFALHTEAPSESRSFNFIFIDGRGSYPLPDFWSVRVNLWMFRIYIVNEEWGFILEYLSSLDNMDGCLIIQGKVLDLMDSWIRIVSIRASVRYSIDNDIDNVFFCWKDLCTVDRRHVFMPYLTEIIGVLGNPVVPEFFFCLITNGRLFVCIQAFHWGGFGGSQG